MKLNFQPVKGTPIEAKEFNRREVMDTAIELTAVEREIIEKQKLRNHTVAEKIAQMKAYNESIKQIDNELAVLWAKQESNQGDLFEEGE